MVFSLLNRFWNALQTGSVLSDIWSRVGKLFEQGSYIYGAVRDIAKVGESILSKLALNGVSVGVLTTGGFFVLLSTGLDKLMEALVEIKAGLEQVGYTGATMLSEWNYYLPIDTIATVILLYVSIWAGVAAFKGWDKVLSLLFGVKSATK